jgi:DNA-binding transcriptional LysR family regulator
MFNLTLRRLEVFVTVVETGGFSAAAARLGIAQPSVSSHVQALEAKAGGLLFDRLRGRRPQLTALGTTFLSHARQLLTEADKLSTNIDRKRRATPQRIVFACQRSLANYVFPSLLTGFARHHPQTEVVVRIGMQEDVHAQVAQGTADLGCLLSNEEPPNLASTIIGRQRLVFIAAPDHPLAGRERIAPAQLQDYDFVGSPPGSMFGQQVSQLLRHIGVEQVRMAFQATEYQFIRELVLAGVGIACSAVTSVQQDVRAGTLVVLPVDAPPLTLDIRQIVSRRRPMSTAASTFADYLREKCAAADMLHEPATA